MAYTPVTPTYFRVGTFNLCNLALPDREYYPRQAYSAQEYEKKLQWVGQQLDRMRVDVVGFQEVFDRPALDQALQRSPYHRHHAIALAPGFGKGPGVALASGFPILQQRMYDEFPAEGCLDLEGLAIPVRNFSHPVLAVDLALTEQITCTVVVVHLKSKRPMLSEGGDRTDPVELAKGQARSLIRRAAEATALRFLLMDLLQHRRHPVIVMGDVNDNPTAITTQILSGQPPWESWPFRRKAPVWDVLLHQVKDIQARLGYGDHYYTHIHNGYYDSLDQIMVSEEFVAQNLHRLGRVTYVSVYNDHLVDQTLENQTIEPWQSDHGQVVATIELRSPAEGEGQTGER
ncbi:MAG: endonuclease/exonuclease/phosphatase family protein [Cyanobacteriota bacterium]|nr:endonuclease/exonuclease/phosphatase family protein [Cyanobacteriota bacterium]